MNGFPPTAGAYSVRAPRLYHFNPESNTQIQEFLRDALSLKEYALKHFSSPDSSRKPLCLELGRSLGVWLRDFHSWVALPEQSKFQEEMKSNEPMQKIKHMANYITLADTVANFPSILADAKETFEKIKEVTADELHSSHLQIIHGDFWTGK
jgi:hypothetical protein